MPAPTSTSKDRLPSAAFSGSENFLPKSTITRAWFFILAADISATPFSNLPASQFMKRAEAPTPASVTASQSESPDGDSAVIPAAKYAADGRVKTASTDLMSLWGNGFSHFQT